MNCVNSYEGRGVLPVLAALPFLLCAQSAGAYLAKGKLDGVSLDPGTGPGTEKVIVSGWACKIKENQEEPSPADQDMDIHLYAIDEDATPPALGALIGFYGGDGNGNIVNGPALQATTTEAGECGLTGTQYLRFAIPIPLATTAATYAGKQLRAYALCRPGSANCTSTEIYMNSSTPNVTPYLAYHFSAASNPSGWSDTTNYFTAWGCRAPVDGINTIRRLNIAPIGSHTSYTWKDSLHVDFGEPAGGNPTLYFTGGSAFSVPTFRLEKAQFNNTTGDWEITSFHDNYANPSGVSSNDGTGTDYIMNVYNRGGLDSLPVSYEQDGWGPAANKPADPTGALPAVPGSYSMIPAVSTTAVGGEYPLIGNGPLGISAIRAIRGDSGDLNTRSCIHMNPSLFNYDQGHPRGLMTCLWTGHPDALLPEPYGHPWPTEGCALPGVSSEVTQSAHYVYRQDPNKDGDPDENGWQLVPEPLSMLGNCAQVGTVNYVQGSAEQFLVTRWEGRIDLFDLPTKTITESILDCTMPPGTPPENVVNFAEATGHQTHVFFIADPLGPKEGPANGLPPKMRIHDIYVGFRQ